MRLGSIHTMKGELIIVIIVIIRVNYLLRHENAMKMIS